jgi:hypothetical protein
MIRNERKKGGTRRRRKMKRKIYTSRAILV